MIWTGRTTPCHTHLLCNQVDGRWTYQSTKRSMVIIWFLMDDFSWRICYLKPNMLISGPAAVMCHVRTFKCHEFSSILAFVSWNLRLRRLLETYVVAMEHGRTHVVRGNIPKRETCFFRGTSQSTPKGRSGGGSIHPPTIKILAWNGDSPWIMNMTTSCNQRDAPNYGERLDWWSWPQLILLVGVRQI
jgi:hypothetical protein